MPGPRAAATPRTMLQIVESLPAQIEEGMELARRVRVSPTFPSRVVVCGMGGSAISGDLVASLPPTKQTPQIMTVRHYDLPPFVTKGDLVVAVSYSGNTEETLGCFAEAEQRGCTLAAITSGGALAQASATHGHPVVPLPPGLPPRGAVGYLFSALAMVLEAFGALAVHRDLEALVGYLGDLRGRWGSGAPKDNEARALAHFLRDRIPITYSTPDYASVARRWQTQMNENAKVLAWHGELPEMDHNELVGWSGDDRAKGFAALFLRDAKEDKAMDRRIGATQALMEGRVPLKTLVAAGNTRVERLFHLLYLGDFASVYLAEERGVDPMPVTVIDDLKARLARR